MSKKNNNNNKNMIATAAIVAAILISKHLGSNNTNKNKGGIFQMKDAISMGVAALALAAALINPFVKYNDFKNEVTYKMENLKSEIQLLKSDQQKLNSILDDKVRECKSNNSELKDSIRSLESSIQNIYSSISNLRKNKR